MTLNSAGTLPGWQNIFWDGLMLQHTLSQLQWCKSTGFDLAVHWLLLGLGLRM